MAPTRPSGIFAGIVVLNATVPREAPLASVSERAVQPPLPPPSEAELVARLRAGDEAACEALFMAHHEGLWRFAFGYVRSREVAEEIVQEVFLQLWRDRARCDVRASMRALLYAAVRNHALNHLRHERVVARIADRMSANAVAEPGAPVAAMGAPAADAQVVLEDRELDEVVTRAIAALPERRRVAMSLRWAHGLSAPEIARVVGTTPEAVRVLLTRARQELASLLADRRRPDGAPKR